MFVKSEPRQTRHINDKENVMYKSQTSVQDIFVDYHFFNVFLIRVIGVVANLWVSQWTTNNKFATKMPGIIIWGKNKWSAAQFQYISIVLN